MNQKTIITGIVLAAALAGGIFFLKSKRGPMMPAPLPKQAENWIKAKGPQGAPIQIVEYSDFQCPACMRAEPVLKAIMEEYPEKIRFIYLHYPLPMHQWSGLAHQAAECANRQGKFWEYHDRLYKEQPAWSVAFNVPELIVSYAGEAGIDLQVFGTCLSDGGVTQQILKERASGQTLQIRSTPTFFINGQRVVGEIELEGKGRDIIRQILGLPPLPKKVEASPAAPSPSPAPAAPQP